MHSYRQVTIRALDGHMDLVGYGRGQVVREMRRVRGRWVCQESRSKKMAGS